MIIGLKATILSIIVLLSSLLHHDSVDAKGKWQRSPSFGATAAEEGIISHHWENLSQHWNGNLRGQTRKD